MEKRVILFRGKRVDNGEWVEGSYQADVMSLNKHTIIYSDSESYYCEDEVTPETVGQYIGLKDKNRTKIFEGDRLHCWGGEYWMGVWEFDEIIDVDDIRNLDYISKYEHIEVIGNIHEGVPIRCFE